MTIRSTALLLLASGAPLSLAIQQLGCGPGDGCEVTLTCPTSGASNGGGGAAPSAGGAGGHGGDGHGGAGATGGGGGEGGAAPDTCGNNVVDPGEVCFPTRGTDHNVSGLSPLSARIFDCDGDGVEDILTVNALSSNLSFLPLNGGQVGTAQTTPVNVTSPLSFDAGVIFPVAGRRIVVGSASNAMQVFTFNESCALQAGNSTSLGAPPVGGVLVLDKDDNGIDDVVAVTDDDLLFASNGNLSTTYTTSHPAVQARKAIVARLDANSRDDVAFLSPIDNKLWWALDGGGGLYWTITAASSIGTGANPSAIVAADFDGDNVDDVAVTNKNANTVTVFMNDGSGFLSKRQSDIATATFLASATQPSAIAAGDIDGDGDVDLVVGHESHISGESAIIVLRNDGTGTFSLASVHTLAYRQVHDLHLFDVNADGALDIISVSAHDDGPNGGRVTAVIAEP